MQLKKKKHFESLAIDEPSHLSRMLTEESKDEEMSSQNLPSVKERLQRFWSVTAPTVMLSEAAPVDRQNISNPFMVAEYAQHISEELLRVEKESLPSPNYMSHQTDINFNMRAILVDWIIEVHLKFKLLPETLFITINLIDRYLSQTNIRRKNLQLVGVTCMFIASKYEDIYPPPVIDFANITDNAYTTTQIFEMEFSVLSTLNFNITCCSPYRFLERFY